MLSLIYIIYKLLFFLLFHLQFQLLFFKLEICFVPLRSCGAYPFVSLYTSVRSKLWQIMLGLVLPFLYPMVKLLGWSSIVDMCATHCITSCGIGIYTLLKLLHAILRTVHTVAQGFTLDTNITRGALTSLTHWPQ